jgi:hypothetical protein
MTDREKLRKMFREEASIECTNEQGEPDIDYVAWLENRLTAATEQREREMIAFVGANYESFNGIDWRKAGDEKFTLTVDDIISQFRSSSQAKEGGEG